MLLKAETISEAVEVASEYLFLGPNDDLTHAVTTIKPTEMGMRRIGDKALEVMGLGDVLYAEDEEAKLKDHDSVSVRDAAVAEQFFHADVAARGFAGILLIGLNGEDPDSVPETQTVSNIATLEFMEDFVADGPLENRLHEVRVVRPYLDPADRSEWMNYPRHVLVRLSQSPFRELLTPAQLEHVDSYSRTVTDRSRYTGSIFVSRLVNLSVIDGEAVPSCGVSSREIRLSFGGEQTEEEKAALTELHDAIAEYLLSSSVEYDSHKVVQGSVLFVPANQLHRATPYLPKVHMRSIAAVKCYPVSSQTAPESWRHASGTDY